jgi:hypothetical protein
MLQFGLDFYSQIIKNWKDISIQYLIKDLNEKIKSKVGNMKGLKIKAEHMSENKTTRSFLFDKDDSNF